MNITARITSVWKKRMLLLIAFVAGSGLWFFYDAFIGWPAEAKRHERYIAFKEKLIEDGTSREVIEAPHNKMLEQEWRKYALENGFGTRIPSARADADFASQKKYGTVIAIISLGMLGWFFLSCSRVLRSDENTIFCPGGREVPFDAITGVDKKKWDNKGIAVVFYKTADGKTAKATLDDYKYAGADAILEEAERRLAAKQAL